MLSEVAANHPSSQQVQEAIDEVARINGVYWKIMHFDKWSPFCNPTVGKHYAAGANAGPNCAVTMQRVAQEWRRDQRAGLGDDNDAGLLQNSLGNTSYADLLQISAAVGFRSAELPELYAGVWHLEWEELKAAPLIENMDGGLDMQIHWQRFAALQA